VVILAGGTLCATGPAVGSRLWGDVPSSCPGYG